MPIQVALDSPTGWTKSLNFQMPEDLALSVEDVVTIPAGHEKNLKAQIVLPGSKPVLKKFYQQMADDACKATTKNSRTRVQPQIKKVVEKVLQEKAAEGPDGSGKKDAYSTAKKQVDELNKYLEKQYFNLLGEVKRTLAGKLNVKEREVEIIVKKKATKSVELHIVPGVFKTEFSVEESADFSDLQEAVKYKNKWQYCGVVAKGTKAYLVVSRLKPVKMTQLKVVQKFLGGAGRMLEGVCKFSSNEVELVFKKTTTKFPQGKHVRDGLKDQLADPQDVELGKEPPVPIKQVKIEEKQLSDLPKADKLQKVKELLENESSDKKDKKK